ncbi:hypothetical protein GX441_09720 [bacterium]|nr:hypothetical protein [bacterium]
MRSFWTCVFIGCGLLIVDVLFYLLQQINTTPLVFYLGVAVDQLTFITPIFLALFGYLGLEKDWSGRSGWLLVFLALSFYAVGDTIWNVYGSMKVEPPYPGLSDVFYFFFPPLMISAMMIFLRLTRTKRSPVQIICVSAAGGLLLGFLLWKVIIPHLAEPQIPLTIKLLDLYYPLADMIIFTIGLLILLQVWGGQISVSFLLFLSGIFVLIVVDALYSLFSENWGYRNPLDILWNLAYLLIALALVYERTLHKRIRDEL